MTHAQLNAKLVICSVPTKNSAAAQQFYNTLLGGDDFARTINDQIESSYRPISKDGLILTIAARQNDREPITCFFAVDNLDETVKQLEAAGGTVVVTSAPVAVSAPDQVKQAFADVVGQNAPATAGNWVGMIDPDGNYLGLLQLDSSTERSLNAGPEGRTLSKAQVQQHDNWKKHGEKA